MRHTILSAVAAAVCAAQLVAQEPAPAQNQQGDTPLLEHAANQARVRAAQLMGGAVPQDRGQSNYREALADMQRGQMADAALSLQAALQRNRNNPLYHGDLAYALATLQRFDEAANSYTAASRLQERNGWYLVGLAGVRAAQQRYADAAATMELAAQADSAIIDARFAVAAAAWYDQAGDRARGLHWWRVATRLSPDDPIVWVRMAISLRSANDSAEGLTAARRYLALRPGDHLGSALLSHFLFQVGQVDSAIALAQYASEDSTYRSFAAETYLRAGARFIQQRDYRRALDILGRGRQWSTPEMAPFFANYMGRAELQIISTELQRVSDQRDCQGAQRADTVLARVRENLTQGMSVDSQRTAMMLESVLPGYVDNARRMAEAYCRPQQRPPARRRP